MTAVIPNTAPSGAVASTAARASFITCRMPPPMAMTPVAMDRKSTVGVSGAWMALTAWTDPGNDPAKKRL